MREKKTLFVTGASSELGCSLIENVADNYDIVVAHYRSSVERLLPLEEKLGAKLMLVQADFSDSVSVRKMLDFLSEREIKPDHIVHMAALPMENKHFKKQSWCNFAENIETDLRPIVEILGEFLPAMSKQKYGKVIFMLTSCTVGMPPKYTTVYTTAKYALLGLLKSLAAEYAEKGITVNGVSPEMIDTRFLKDLPDLIKEMNAQNMPQKENLKVEQVVPTLAFLLSDGADMISGQNIAITDAKA
ncbi:3-oxoacyl-[acyl-carrier protein] reductase [Pseudobutyrivibrio sp. ACV-2]|uniref:SDR family oxidoreductase n=1 Tax=Pseudobutyrivibrio sp. ACV-2 TaxID=1520801 RepID=UPI000898CD4A|nr:SDR family oxidoreductase [Pseudobutyrivibrio sp. ACV-2]SEA51552.1 3-oxoacyl-[acyl-carrier protein] reductase [Pseudobutyrivibrio sp. ACV-2]